MKSCLFALLLVVGVVAPSVVNAQETSCKITKAKFDSIENGMSYDDVIAKFECVGSLISESDIMGMKTEMYSWSGRGTLGANMNAMFQDGQMISKSQFGLQ